MCTLFSTVAHFHICWGRLCVMYRGIVILSITRKRYHSNLWQHIQHKHDKDHGIEMDSSTVTFTHSTVHLSLLTEFLTTSNSCKYSGINCQVFRFHVRGAGQAVYCHCSLFSCCCCCWCWWWWCWHHAVLLLMSMRLTNSVTSVCRVSERILLTSRTLSWLTDSVSS